MIIGYARIGPFEAEPAEQTAALRAAGCDQVLSDRRVSGIALDRPALAQALNLAKPGDTLAVWRLDRLARNLGQLLDLMEQIDAAGLSFVSVADGIDTRQPERSSFLAIARALKLFEAHGRRERTLADLAEVRRASGRPSSISDEAWVTMKVSLAQPGATVTGVAAAADVSRQAIYYRLGREISDASYLAFKAALIAGADRAQLVDEMGLFPPAIHYRESREARARVQLAAQRQLSPGGA